ncbi:hypothetical protein [Pleionea sp. CnH1-48]|uniref:hypothetical protein n=1 Tax=Pleionea sp. CnH1-48 TaxID=2954494 RepID=UPI00209834E6|nr:hypothetical protein [Pleionea sp. CnH1-48]MCO7224761.1 hypothetical protein [Pleionea sp. CnH1-48]
MILNKLQNAVFMITTIAFLSSCSTTKVQTSELEIVDKDNNQTPKLEIVGEGNSQMRQNLLSLNAQSTDNLEVDRIEQALISLVEISSLSNIESCSEYMKALDEKDINVEAIDDSTIVLYLDKGLPIEKTFEQGCQIDTF